MTGYELAKGIIIFEFAMVAIFIVLTFILKFFYDWRARRIQAQINQMESYLETATPQQKLVFPRKWQKLEYIVPIILRLDQTLKASSWPQVRENLIESIVLPLARNAATQSQRHWIRRFYAAEVFSLATHREDEKYIQNLVEDEIPLVYLNALPAAIACGSQNLVHAIILQISSQRRLTQGTYLQAFVDAPQDIVSVVVGLLNTSTDPYVRTTCYKILMLSEPTDSTWDLNADLSSPNLELRIAALRYLTMRSQNDAIPLLTSLLNDPQWEMKVAALNSLGSLNARTAIPQIAESLRDPEWWVRMNAGQVLLNMGDAGVSILKEQNPNVDKFAYDVAQYLLVTK
jgi:hypothetical protein